MAQKKTRTVEVASKNWNFFLHFLTNQTATLGFIYFLITLKLNNKVIAVMKFIIMSYNR